MRFPADQAVPETALRVVCPRDGIEWRLELVVDEAVEGALHAIWTDLEPEL